VIGASLASKITSSPFESRSLPLSAPLPIATSRQCDQQEVYSSGRIALARG
jgi:hypothetical protein